MISSHTNMQSSSNLNVLIPYVHADPLYIQSSPTPFQGIKASLKALNQSSKKLESGSRLLAGKCECPPCCLSLCCSPNPRSTPHTPAPLFLRCPSFFSLLEPPPSLLDPPLPTNCHPPLPPSPSSPELGLTGEKGASPAGPSLWLLRSLSLLSSKKEAGLEISCSLLILGLLLSLRLDIWRWI